MAIVRGRQQALSTIGPVYTIQIHRISLPRWDDFRVCCSDTWKACMSQVTTGVYQSVQSDPAWRLLFSGATYSDLCCSRRYLLKVGGSGLFCILHVYSICIGLLRLHVTVPCNSRRFTGQASAGDAHHIMSNSSGPSSSALHGAEHTRVGTIPHWGVFFLTRLLQ